MVGGLATLSSLLALTQPILQTRQGLIDGDEQPGGSRSPLPSYAPGSGAEMLSHMLHERHQVGYVLVPGDPDALEKALRHAQFDQAGRLIESAELRLLRLTLRRVASLRSVERPPQGAWREKMQLASIVAIHRLWADETLPVVRVVALSHWVWCHVVSVPWDWGRTRRAPVPTGDLPAACARHLALLRRPMYLKRDRDAAFRHWVTGEMDVWGDASARSQA